MAVLHAGLSFLALAYGLSLPSGLSLFGLLLLHCNSGMLNSVTCVIRACQYLSLSIYAYEQMF